MKTKIILIYISLFIAAIVALTIVINGRRTEDNILGSWHKESLEFERVNYEDHQIKSYISQIQDKEIGHELMIDNVDNLVFEKDSQLKIKNNEKQQKDKLSWKLKGRGNIIEIKDLTTNNKESYQVQELSKDKLVVYINLDLQVRGIVKITFTKNNTTYAKKI
ncbi:hypothetical protein [Chishuiella sp.]|uniref:hypothetical protein n=1 Tax=Chishuiella sp. TaxID=1969467 RepID=UPI0028AB8879|nr:hypothetical protein [Chishuiella sp.]